jgi:hypothetical protein
MTFLFRYVQEKANVKDNKKDKKAERVSRCSCPTFQPTRHQRLFRDPVTGQYCNRHSTSHTKALTRPTGVDFFPPFLCHRPISVV